ncbi:MAG: AsmA-like C-terminal region-containing protein, partial [Alphaproteobacteria bacterium]|nr:AsmA-like C-terminal region-containing protein [Alphaproteobacteria bacterium]
ISTGIHKALLANILLKDDKNIDAFSVQGDIPNIQSFLKWLDIDGMFLPKMNIDISGALQNNKIVLQKSTVKMDKTLLSLSGYYDYTSKTKKIKLDCSVKNINIYKQFPQLFGAGQPWVHPDRELNAFHDMDLYGKYLYNTNADIHIKLDDFIVYRSLNLRNIDLTAKLKNNKLRLDADVNMVDGNVKVISFADIDKDGKYTIEAGAIGENIVIGQILKEININTIISQLPVNVDLYVRASGKNMSEIMSTITGPVRVYSTDIGYANSQLVEYMYGTDFLTSLHNTVSDLFRKTDTEETIPIKCTVANIKLRNGALETKNGVAVETGAINVRLVGNLNLGKETIDLSLATVPVTGLKLSLTGNLVNTLQIVGNLAEPDFKISGAAVAGKVASATGLGILLAPVTGGLSIAGGLIAGLVAGDFLEGWLADDNPCNTAMEEGASKKRHDKEWLNTPLEDLTTEIFNRE